MIFKLFLKLTSFPESLRVYPVFTESILQYQLFTLLRIIWIYNTSWCLYFLHSVTKMKYSSYLCEVFFGFHSLTDKIIYLFLVVYILGHWNQQIYAGSMWRGAQSLLMLYTGQRGCIRLFLFFLDYRSHLIKRNRIWDSQYESVYSY